MTSFQITVSAEAGPAFCTVQLVDDSTAQAYLQWAPDIRVLANDMVQGILAPGTAPVEVREEGAFRYYRMHDRIKSDWSRVKFSN